MPFVPVDPRVARLVRRDNRRVVQEQFMAQSAVHVGLQSPTEAKPLVGKSAVARYEVMPERQQCLPDQPGHHENSGPGCQVMACFLLLRKFARLGLPTQGSADQREKDGSSGEPTPIRPGQPRAPNPAPTPLEPVCIKKNQRRRDPHQWKPANVIENDEVVCRVEEHHENHRKNPRSPDQQQKSD